MLDWNADGDSNWDVIAWNLASSAPFVYEGDYSRVVLPVGDEISAVRSGEKS